MAKRLLRYRDSGQSITPASIGRIKAYDIEISARQVAARALKDCLQRTFVAQVMNPEDPKEGNLDAFRRAWS
jgi:hypothetical protein